MKFDNAAFQFAAGKAEQLPSSTLPEIVFSGRSNVGKSSLINKLLNRKSLARVSATPGKTGTINFYSLPDCHLVDLPGYGYAKVSQEEKFRWAKLVEGYFSQERDIRLVIQILDMRHKPTADDLQMLDFLEQSGFAYVVVSTKSDKLNKTQYAQQKEFYEALIGKTSALAIIPFSSVNGEGVEQLKELIASLCIVRP